MDRSGADSTGTTDTDSTGGSQDDAWTGGWDEDLPETATVQPEPDETETWEHARFPDPTELPPPTDPSEASWWAVGTAATAVTVLGFFLVWPLGYILLTAEGPRTFGIPHDPLPAASLLVVVFIVGVRFFVLPLAMWKDASELRTADVDWSPSPRFYLAVGLLWSSVAYLLYLYKRSRYTGRPDLPISTERLDVMDSPIPSNWPMVIWLGAAVEPMVFVLGMVTLLVSSPAVLMLFVGITLALVVVRVCLVPIAFYKDATVVEESQADWEPRTWFYVAFGWLVPLLIGGHYLSKRADLAPD